MALFYDYNVAVPANLRQICSVWGELDPVLAVALENREIHFFTDEGSFTHCVFATRPALSKDSNIKKPSPSDYKQSSSSSRPSSREAKSRQPTSRPSSREAHSIRPGYREAAMSRPNSREDKMRHGDDDEIEDEMEEDIAEDE
ncbi:imidazolonepropionase [Phytophthora nicotianae]|uniref:Imidazolonepropionase n=1 Tax=Phytophthora nicotianae TaxID=4792 RepID=A0A0W8DL94_PHYNI|nr:imidazolonepropionase [Phytophthora nicotianae]